MNINANIKYLNKNQENLSDKIAENLKEVEAFLIFLMKKDITKEQDITRDDIIEYITDRRKQGGDLYWVLLYITNYVLFTKNEELTSESMLLQDAWNIMNRASELTKKFEIEEIWAKVFGGVEMPQMGSILNEMADLVLGMIKTF